MMIIDLPVAFAAAILCGLGSGGGIFVLYLTFALGMSQVTAQGVNLVFFLSSALGAFAVNSKNRLIDFRSYAIISLAGIPMAVVGSIAAASVGGNLLSRMYGGLLVFSGLYYFFQKN